MKPFSSLKRILRCKLEEQDRGPCRVCNAENTVLSVSAHDRGSILIIVSLSVTFKDTQVLHTELINYLKSILNIDIMFLKAKCSHLFKKKQEPFQVRISSIPLSDLILILLSCCTRIPFWPTAKADRPNLISFSTWSLNVRVRPQKLHITQTKKVLPVLKEIWLRLRQLS